LGKIVTLSEYLREGTADLHREAESSAFVSRFMNGGLDRDTHSRHLLALQTIYTALEDGLESLKDDPRLAAFHLPALWRRAALQADLEYLRGPRWHDEAPVPAARTYAEHLRALTTDRPLRLVSHAYVRYMGDLSGGQVLRRMAARQLGLSGDGVRFYEFPEISDVGAFKSDFRRRLDELPLVDGEREALLNEARSAFHLNAVMFAELA